MDSAGSVYVADTGNEEIRKISAAGLVGSDTAAFSETYNTKNAGTGLTLTPIGSVNDGNGGNNYAVTFVSVTTGVINKAPLTITAAANTKTYDGTTSAAATPTVVGLQGTDRVTGLSETYNNKNAGTGKTLSVAAGYVVSDGNSGSNYALSLVANTTGQIAPLAITVTAVSSTKTYDGTTSSAATPTITAGSLAASIVTTLAGFALQQGSSDGTGSAARFYQPAGVAVDSAGNVYVADQNNDEIRKITPSGVVTTLAGSAGQTGSSDGTGSAARFNDPQGVAVDSAGNVYVADEQNDEIRKVSPSGVVSTLAGFARQNGSSDGTGSAARFDLPPGVAVDSAGNVYVADWGNSEIRKISPSGVVTTLAGSFDYPMGVAVDSAGNVYVADTGNEEIRKITPSGAVTTLAGSAGQTGSSDGAGSAARFYGPTSVAVDSAGNVYVADVNNDEIRQISPSGVVTTLAGSAGQRGSSDGTGSAARFGEPQGVGVDSAGNVYVADHGNDEIRLVSTAGLASGDTAAFSETYNTKNAGTGLTLTPAGSVSDGNGGHNYAVTFVSVTTGVINKAPLTITAAANAKTYDGTTSAAATPTVAGLQGSSDTVTGLSETYDNKNAGTGKTLSVAAGYTVSDGNGGANYTTSLVTNTTGQIAPLAITVTAVSSTKTYDGTTSSAATPTITSGYVVTTLAGSAGQVGSSDGTGSAARFYSPAGVAVDSAGNVYVADYANQEIRKITPSGVVTTLAGATGQAGSSDGTGSTAQFDEPQGVAVDSTGDVYVADAVNDEIRKITPSGVVTTLAGSAEQVGSSDGTGSAARFVRPTGVAVDSAGNVYVADYENQEIRKITPSGAVSTLAGSAMKPGSSDGTGSAARFDYPTAVAADSAGNVYVADYLNQEIRKITPSGVVTTLAGSTGQTGSSNGTGSAARFYDPWGVALDSAGDVYVADWHNVEIRKISPSDVVTTLAGSAGQYGSSDGTGSAARFYSPAGVAVDSAGNVYVADDTNDAVRAISTAGLVRGDTAAFTETYDTKNAGTGKTLTPAGSVSDGNGGNNYAVTFVTSTTGVINQAGLTITAATSTKTYDGTTSSTASPTIGGGGVVTTLAGSAGQQGSSNGTGSAARFTYPTGVAVDSAGNVYVAGFRDDEIRKITPSGVVTTLAGAAGQGGSSDGTGSAARFTWPQGVAVDSTGNVYVADDANDEVRKITPSGVVTTLAGSAGQQGSSDGTGSAARFYFPLGVAVDSTGNVYVADWDNDEIRRITPSGVVTTLAGSAGQTGSSDGSGSAARFNEPYDVAVDSAGNVYVADYVNSEIRKITPSGVVTTLAGSAGLMGSNDGTGSAARFKDPSGVAVDNAGNVYVADNNNDEIREITPSGVVTTLAGSAGKSGSSDGAASAARFYLPNGVAVDSAGNVYVADYENDEIRKISTAGLVGGDTAAFTESYAAKNVGTGLTLTPTGSVNDGNGGHNYAVTFVSVTTGVINKAGLTITAAANTKTYDGTTSAAATPTVVGLQGGSDTVTGLSETYDNKNAGTGKTLSVAAGYTLSDGNSGNNYLVSLVTNTTGQVTPLAITVTAASSTKTYDGTTSSTATPTVPVAGAVTTLAGSAGKTGSSDGTGGAARFYFPDGAAVDSAGNVYVADEYNDEIRKITPSGVVTTLAGSAGQAGSSNGTGSAARFHWPMGVAVDSAGNVYVADYGNCEIRKITPSGVVTTLAGSGSVGSSDGSGTAARFDAPAGVAVDSAGNVYVADTFNSDIRKITSSGVVTTLAGSAGQTGSGDGTGTAARFNSDYGVAVDSAGNVYVGDTANNEIREITPSGVVTTLAGSAGQHGSSDGSGSAARFYLPQGVAVDSAGSVYVADVLQ